MRITLKQLKVEQACPRQLRIFEYHFPDGVRVTKALCVKHARRFRFEWAGNHLLRGAAKRKFRKMAGPIWVRYNDALLTLDRKVYWLTGTSRSADELKVTRQRMLEFALAFWECSKVKP